MRSARGRMTGGEETELLDLVGEAILVRDPHGRILAWNRGAEELYGWPRAQAIGRLADELLATEYPGSLGEIDARLLQSGRWDGELGRATARGAKLVVDAR